MTTQHGQNILLQVPAVLCAGFLLRRVVAQEAFCEVRDCGCFNAFEAFLRGIFSVEDTRE
jgi:hypothetical protein